MNGSVRVLVVDDDVAVQASLGAFLEDEGFCVQTTGTAAGALDIIGKDPIDVAIVDIRLKEMDGQSLILRAAAMNRQTHYLIYTGSIGYQLPELLSALGMKQSNVIYKPARSLKLISEAVNSLMSKEQSHVER